MELSYHIFGAGAIIAISGIITMFSAIIALVLEH